MNTPGVSWVRGASSVGCLDFGYYALLQARQTKLEASDEYTQAKFGNEFPGQEVRVGGEDPFKGAEIGDDVEPSPQGKDEVKKSFADFQKGDERVEVIKTPEQIQAQNDEYFADLQNLLQQSGLTPKFKM